VIVIGKHVHDLAYRAFDCDPRIAEEAAPERPIHEAERHTFLGFRRSNGCIGRHNHLIVLTSVNCSGSVPKVIAEEVERSGSSTGGARTPRSTVW
jgi:hypothetical protein